MLDIRPFFLLPLALYSVSCATDDAVSTSTATTTGSTATTTGSTTTSETTTASTTTSETETAITTVTTSETGVLTETTKTLGVEPCTDEKTGTGVGFCGEDFTLLNSVKEAVSLYDYAGDVILLDLSGFT